MSRSRRVERCDTDTPRTRASSLRCGGGDGGDGQAAAGQAARAVGELSGDRAQRARTHLSLIHISEPTRLGMISYAVFCLKKKKKHGDAHRAPDGRCHTNYLLAADGNIT